ncbi:MAG: helix-turn-helix domain-containing protein [Rhizobiales bacterium]|nr:helix-turn-helix domain-containing protein [Hyphomicrobiales bacterium]
MTIEQIAQRLNSSPDHVKALVKDGSLKFVNIGRGKKRPRYRFAESDLAEFVERRTIREAQPCQFSESKTHRSITTNSGSKVIGFAELRKLRTAAKRKT